MSGFVTSKTLVHMILRQYLGGMNIASNLHQVTGRGKKYLSGMRASRKVLPSRRKAKKKPGRRRRSYNGGLAFEYLVAVAISSILRAWIVPGSRLWLLMNEYNKIRSRKVARLMRDHAWTLAEEITSRIPGMAGPVRLLGDARGRNGDVCDMEVGRKGKAALGISCKWRNRELKHPRVSIRTDLLGGWIGFGTSGPWFSASMRKLFAPLERAIRRNPHGRWADFGGRSKLVVEVAALCAGSLRRRISRGKISANKLLTFIFSGRDYCVACGGYKNPTLTYFNPRGTLNPRAIKKTRMPQGIVSSTTRPGKPGTMVIGMAGSGGAAGPLLNFRLHSAKGTMEMSLKFGVTLSKGSEDFLETIPLDARTAPATFPRPTEDGCKRRANTV